MTATKLGIWMDHDHAHLTEFTTDPLTTKTIESNFTHQDKVHSMHKGESVMHVKEQHRHSEYYKHLGEVIRNYQEVVLFGPTSAKTELHNTLKGNHLFANIKIGIKEADKMTENQKHAFVRMYFSKQ